MWWQLRWAAPAGAYIVLTSALLNPRDYFGADRYGDEYEGGPIVFLAPYALAFEQVEEVFHNRTPTAAHAGGQIVLLKELLPLTAGELRALPGYFNLCQKRQGRHNLG